MEAKFLLIILIAQAIPSFAQSIAKNDALSIKNTECAAFYSVMTSLVKPEKKAEYTNKYELHKNYGVALHDSPQSYDDRFHGFKIGLTENLNGAKVPEDKSQILSRTMVTCYTIESHTSLLINQPKPQSQRK